jgi:transcriptional regulator GlxA family with amidase domain
MLAAIAALVRPEIAVGAFGIVLPQYSDRAMSTDLRRGSAGCWRRGRDLTIIHIVLPHTLDRTITGGRPRKAAIRSPVTSSVRTSSASPARPRVGIAVFPDAEELDWAGPWEVFAYWADRWLDEVEVFTVAEELEPIRCARGLRILPDRTWSMAPVLDVLIYPGGRGARTEMRNTEILERLRGLLDGGVLLASVCTGSLVLAASGVLDGLAATTHHDALADLGSLGTGIDVRPQDRVVDAGSVITAAGVSAGIDMALYLVARLHSRRRADAIRRAIEYQASA